MVDVYAMQAELQMLRSLLPQMHMKTQELERENLAMRMERGSFMHELHLVQQKTHRVMVDASVQTESAAALQCGTQTERTRHKSVSVQSSPKHKETESQTAAFALPEIDTCIPKDTATREPCLQKLWLLCTTVLQTPKPGRNAFVQNAALILRSWYVYTPRLFLVGERLSSISYQAVDDDMLEIVKKAPAHAFVLSTKPHQRWPPNHDGLRKSNMRLARCVFSQLASIIMCKFIPDLLVYLTGDMHFVSAQAVKLSGVPNVIRIVHAESTAVMEYCLPMVDAIGVALTLPNQKKWVLTFPSVLHHTKEDAVGDAVTMTDLGHTERLLHSDDCEPIEESQLVAQFTKHLANAQNLVGIRACDLVESLRPALAFTFQSMHYLTNWTPATNEALVSRCVSWAQKCVKSADHTARLKKTEMICLPL